jgi:hypothetical protein
LPSHYIIIMVVMIWWGSSLLLYPNNRHATITCLLFFFIIIICLMTRGLGKTCLTQQRLSFFYEPKDKTWNPPHPNFQLEMKTKNAFIFYLQTGWVKSSEKFVRYCLNDPNCITTWKTLNQLGGARTKVKVEKGKKKKREPAKGS